MHFEGEFRVPGKAGDVLKRFADVPRMAKCMPGAVLEPQAGDGSWPGAMVVSFGPKKINFKGKAACVFDHEALTGSVVGRGTADMRAARIGVKVAFALSDVPGAMPPETSVKIVSDAELGGVLADFAKTGGIAVANVIMADFARRAYIAVGGDQGAVCTVFPAVGLRALNPRRSTLPPAPITTTRRSSGSERWGVDAGGSRLHGVRLPRTGSHGDLIELLARVLRAVEPDDRCHAHQDHWDQQECGDERTRHLPQPD